MKNILITWLKLFLFLSCAVALPASFIVLLTFDATVYHFCAVGLFWITTLSGYFAVVINS